MVQVKIQNYLGQGEFPYAYLHNNMLCELCKLFPCTQSHTLHCPKLTTTMVVDNKIKLNESFLYGSVEQQLVYVKIYKLFWDLREKVVAEQSDEEEEEIETVT